jgi:uncharacterized protein (DUF427 family)
MVQKWKFETTERRIRVKFAGETIADSSHAMLLIESHYELHYYIPIDDVRMDLLEATDHTESSGYKGISHFYNVRVGGQIAEQAAWAYPESIDNRPNLEGYIAFVWDKMDAWYEEEEEALLHPRNPYHRVDTIPSSRHIKVLINGETVAETHQPHLLFETNIRTRYYIPIHDVRMDILKATDNHSICPYKGEAEYWSANINGKTYEDIVWSYPNPIPEIPKIQGLMSF